MQEAKSRLSQLIAEVERGGEVVIARNGTPVARLTRVAAPSRKPRVLGRDRGQFVIPGDFNDPDPEIEAMFYGDDSH